MTTNGGFKIPENYFEEFKQRIPEIIDEQKGDIKPRSNRLSIYYAVAACVVLLIISSVTFLPMLSEPEDNVISYELSDAEYYDLEMDDLYYAYNDDLPTEVVAEISDDEMADYIADEIDLDELILLSE